ncbi:MAG: helix-turn-helix domain-containing protein [Hydrogenobacter sp.]
MLVFKKDLSQEDLPTLTGIPRTTISAIETG